MKREDYLREKYTWSGDQIQMVDPSSSPKPGKPRNEGVGSMIVEYLSVSTGGLLDTITVPPDGPLEYATGAARAQVESIERLAGSRAALVEALRSWSNGYVQLRERA